MTNGGMKQLNLAEIGVSYKWEDAEGFDLDIRLEKRLISKIKTILAEHFIVQDIQSDIEEGIDFMTFTVKSFKVGVRLRRFKYFKVLSWRNEFTIRYYRPSGNRTEIHKIRDGLVQYLLYGFVDEDETNIIQYFIGDLDVFREHEPEPTEIKWNNPPDSKLAIYKIKQFPENFILFASWRYSPPPV